MRETIPAMASVGGSSKKREFSSLITAGMYANNSASDSTRGKSWKTAASSIVEQESCAMAGKEMDFPARLFHRHYVTQRAGKYDETSRSDQQNAKPTQNRDILRREFLRRFQLSIHNTTTNRVSSRT